MPKHSIVMPAFNCSATLGTAVQSVVGQTCQDWELIIVDDCSTISSDSIYDFYQAHPRIRVHKLDSNIGPAGCRNIALSQATGQFIHFLDSDDYWFSPYLERIEFAHLVSGSPLCFSSYLRVCHPRELVVGSSICHPPRHLTSRDLLIRNSIPLLTSSIDQTRIIVPGFPLPDGIEPLSRPEDQLFWLKLFFRNPGLVAYGLCEPLAVYSVSPSSRSSRKFATLLRQYEVKRSFGLPSQVALFNTLIYALLSLRGKSLSEIMMHLRGMIR